ncbi:ribosomal protein S5 domain 2-type protein [Lipomyces arxii]|uniref:ribosomal protein S5 domain 2-type protein n=1 Tax=Lipomyces arxii TaxID=56418 RepID=UPI0034CDE27F
MSRDLVPSNIENAFMLKALTENVRLDNRSFNQLRNLSIQFSEHEYGVVDVRLGRTRVIGRISAEITEPYPDRPSDGVFIIATEISPMAAPTFETGRKSEEEAVISRIIEMSVRRSGALDTESLCIITGEKCWAVRADVHFLDHDGGLVDAACIAVSAGLLHYRRPDISIEGIGIQRKVIVHPLSERVPVQLSVLHVPICVTFSFFDMRKTNSTLSLWDNRESEKLSEASQDQGDDDDTVTAVLVDATMQEELLRHGYMNVTANTNREICQIQKGGELAVDVGTLLSCAEAAIGVAERITKLINRLLKEDEAGRNVGILAESRAENDR